MTQLSPTTLSHNESASQISAYHEINLSLANVDPTTQHSKRVLKGFRVTLHEGLFDGGDLGI